MASRSLANRFPARITPFGPEATASFNTQWIKPVLSRSFAPRRASSSPGGANEGESLEDALVREVLEECGLRVQVGKTVRTADELCVVRGKNVRKRCTFFRSVLLEDAPVPPLEEDHELLWFMPVEAIARLTHESQRWALQIMSQPRPQHVR